MRKIIYLLSSLIALSSIFSCGNKDNRDYLCFTAEEDGVVFGYLADNYIPGVHLQKSINGKQWTDWTYPDRYITLNTNDKVYVRNLGNVLSNEDGIFCFDFKGKMSVTGDDMSMINFGELTDYCFNGLFSECDLINAPKLPATKLAKYCYQGMFSDCSYLASVPELPATTLVNGCYNDMFYGDEKIKISENVAKGTKIFTCPDLTGINDAVTNMFCYSTGDFEGDPTAGNTYYWYQE